MYRKTLAPRGFSDLSALPSGLEVTTITFSEPLIEGRKDVGGIPALLGTIDINQIDNSVRFVGAASDDGFGWAVISSGSGRGLPGPARATSSGSEPRGYDGAVGVPV